MISGRRWNRWCAFIGVVFVLLAGGTTLGQETYQEEIERWREGREATLKGDDGWLTVSGLFWLKEGANGFGAADDNAIVLPATSSPTKAGVFDLRGDKITLRVNDGAKVTVKNQPVRELEVKSDVTKTPDLISVGDLTLSVIKRGARYGVRLRDKRSLARREFTKLSWFPVEASYRVRARFIPYERPREIAIASVIDETLKMTTPGLLVFQLQGREYRLQPVAEGEKLFILFRDLTSGQTTYGAGRYLYADPPKDGSVVLDFNQAFNPPCAFTAFATCPLPPRQNRLDVGVEAGEKTYHAAKSSKVTPISPTRRTGT